MESIRINQKALVEALGKYIDVQQVNESKVEMIAEKFKPDHREIFDMRFKHNLTLEEIGQREGKSKMGISKIINKKILPVLLEYKNVLLHPEQYDKLVPCCKTEDPADIDLCFTGLKNSIVNPLKRGVILDQHGEVIEIRPLRTFQDLIDLYEDYRNPEIKGIGPYGKIQIYNLLSLRY